MNIVYLTTEDVASGRMSGKVHFWAVAEELAKLGHRVTIVAPRFSSPPVEPQQAGVTVVRFFAPGKNAVGIFCFECVLVAHLWWLKRHFAPHIALVRGGGPGWFMGVVFVLFRALGIPVVLECNGLVWRELAYRKRSWSHVVNAYVSAWQQAVTCSYMIGVSQGITEAYRRLGRRSQSSCRTIPNGTYVDGFRFTENDRLAVREEFGITQETLVAGYVGVFSPWHDIQGMVAAARILAQKHIANVQFVLIGEGTLLDWARHEVRAHGLHNLTLPGKATDRATLHRWMACFDVGLCLYTDLDGSPLKLFEYMAAGIPIIGSGFAQIGEICRARRRGDLVA